MSDNERVTSTAQSSRDAERVKLLNPLPSKPKPQQVENTSPASIKILLTAAQKRDRTLAAELDDWSTPLTSAERNARRAVRAASCPCAAPPCLLFFARARTILPGTSQKAMMPFARAHRPTSRHRAAARAPPSSLLGKCVAPCGRRTPPRIFPAARARSSVP